MKGTAMPLFGKKTPKTEATKPKVKKTKAKKTAKKEHVDTAEIIVRVKGNEVEIHTEGCNGGLVKAFASLFIAIKEDPKLKEMANVTVELVEKHSLAMSAKDLMDFLEFVVNKLGEEKTEKPKRTRKNAKSKVSAKKEN